MRILSAAFDNFSSIPTIYTCDGEGDNPPLLIEDVSEDAKSLVLIVDDPDAPMGLFTHWVVWNIPPSTKQIEDILSEESVEGKNSSGQVGWIAPCPPNGVHHYRFQLYALSNTLSIAPGSTRDIVEKEMENAIIEKAELVGQYEREYQQAP